MCSAMLSLTARPRSPRRTWTSACMACGVIGSLCKWSLRCSRLQASWTLRAADFAVDLCCCCGARTACAMAARGCAPNWVQGAAGLLWEAKYAVEPVQLHLLVCLPSGRPCLRCICKAPCSEVRAISWGIHWGIWPLLWHHKEGLLPLLPSHLLLMHGSQGECPLPVLQAGQL